MLDVPEPGAHDVIGDRAYGETADEVAVLGRAVAEGLIAGGVLPVIKHIPGHGRARADSHWSCRWSRPASPSWRRGDFAPVPGPVRHADGDDRARGLFGDRSGPAGHHVAGGDRDGDPRRDRLRRPADERRPVDEGAERRACDRERRQSLAAGCDIVLHCNGDMAEMAAVAQGARTLAGRALARADAALARLPPAPEPFDAVAGRARFDAAFGGRCAA